MLQMLTQRPCLPNRQDPRHPLQRNRREVRLEHQLTLSPPEVPHSDVRQERIEGFKSALKEYGIDQHVVWDAPDDKSSGVNELHQLLNQNPDTTALICNGDMIALGACFALQKTGKAPGQDLSIIGFDDVQDAALATPALSTISTHPYELGTLLAKTILDRIADPLQPVKTSQIKTQLILRETTAPAT